MILLFEREGVPLFIGVSDKRLVSIASSFTKYVFKPINFFRGQKGFNSSLLGSFNRRVKSFKDDSGVRGYLVGEMFKLGFTFKRLVSKVEYLKFVEAVQ